MAAPANTPAPTGNPVLDDADSGQSYAHPSVPPGGGGNPILTDASVGASGPVAPPGFLQSSWDSIAGGIRGLWSAGRGLATAPLEEGGTSALGAGVGRGYRDFWDKVGEQPLSSDWTGVPSTSPYAPAPLDPKVNAADRASYEQQYGNNPHAQAGRIIGQTLGAAPVTMPLGAGVNAGIDAALPAAGGFWGGLLASAQRGVEGGVGGAAQGAVTADPSQPLGPQVRAGAETGAVMTPTLGAAAYPVRALTGRLPNMIDPDLARWGQTAHDMGVDIDPTKLTTNPTYRIVADQLGKLPFSGVDDLPTRRQFQGALANQMGEQTNNGITYDVMDRAAQRISGVFNGVANRTTIQGGQPLLTDIQNIGADIPRYGLTDAQLAPVRAQFQNVLQAFQRGGGQITGQTYQNLTQTGGPLDTAIGSTDPTVSMFAQRIRDALDNAFQRSASPDDQTALTTARQQYRVMKTVQPLVEQRGAMGDINPNALQQRVIMQSRRFDPSTGGFAFTGGGPVGDLANIGKIFFQPPPDSGSAARGAAMGIVGTGLLTNPVAAGKVAAGLAANRLLQAGMRSPAVGNAMVTGTINPASRDAEIQQALTLLRMPFVANQQQANQQPQGGQ